MFAKTYEIIYSLYLLQRDGLDESSESEVLDFLKAEQKDDFEERSLTEVKRRMITMDTIDPETIFLRASRLLDYMDYAELRLLGNFLDHFMGGHPTPRYDAYRMVLHGAAALNASPSIHITQRSYPNLFKVLNCQDEFRQLLGRLYVLRNQVSEIVREEKGKNIPLWEIVVELAVLHCAHCQMSDADQQIYSTLFRFARRELGVLSFQQVMRLCNNLKTLTRDHPHVHLLLLEQVEKNLDLASRKKLVTMLLEIEGACPQQGSTLKAFVDAVVTASRFSLDDYGRLIFGLSRSRRKVPGHFKIIQLEPGHVEKMDVGDGRVARVSVQLELNATGGIVMKATKGGHVEERTFEKAGEQYLDQTCFLFRPDIKSVCTYTFKESRLFVSSAQLAFRGNHILKDILFAARTGETIAVVGPSGCGKSTMLTMLSGILEYTGGDVYFDRKRISSVEDFSAISTYIPQDDILYRELTVHESIDYSVRLKVKAENAEYDKRLQSTIDVLGLERTEFLKIGNEGEKGISGGQRKRVNIGTTIVADMKPILLFDEPTSGLDPATDIEIMQLLRALSRRGHIVLCVTHNLSDDSINYFDKVMVLGKNGQINFFGKKQRILYFFSISGPQYLFQKMSESAHIDFREKYLLSPESANVEKEVEDERKLIKAGISTHHATTKGRAEKPSRLSNFATFCSREIRRKIRDRQFLLMCLAQPVLIGLFICWNFPGPLPNALFSLITAILWIGSISGVRELNSEWAQLKRDYMSGTSLSAFFAAKVFSCFTFSSAQTILLAAITAGFGGYFAPPFEFSSAAFAASLLLLNLFGICLGLLMSGLIRSPLAAVGVLPVLLIPLVIMGGALIRHHHTDGLQRVAMQFNPLRIAFEACFYGAKGVLRPQLARIEKRDEKMQEKQRKSYVAYLDRLELYRKDPQAYREKYTEVDVNDLFSSMLSDDEPAGEKDISPPTAPADVESGDLLMARPDLWLQGHALLPVDGSGDAGLLEYSRSETWSYFDVRAPRAFSEDLSAQGVTGLYDEMSRGGGLETRSAYRPVEYSLLLIGEVLGLILLTFVVLRKNLAQKFS